MVLYQRLCFELMFQLVTFLNGFCHSFVIWFAEWCRHGSHPRRLPLVDVLQQFNVVIHDLEAWSFFVV